MNMGMSETWYDDEEDVLGMHVKDKPSYWSVEIGKHVVVDFSRDGEIVGVDILRAKQFFKKKDVEQFLAPKALSKRR